MREQNNEVCEVVEDFVVRYALWLGLEWQEGCVEDESKGDTALQGDSNYLEK